MAVNHVPEITRSFRFSQFQCHGVKLGNGTGSAGPTEFPLEACTHIKNLYSQIQRKMYLGITTLNLKSFLSFNFRIESI